MTVEQFIADLDELAEAVRRRSTKKRSQSTGTPTTRARCRRRSFEETPFRVPGRRLPSTRGQPQGVVEGHLDGPVNRADGGGPRPANVLGQRISVNPCATARMHCAEVPRSGTSHA